MSKQRVNWRLMKIVTGKTIGILVDFDLPIGSCQTIPDGEHPNGIENIPNPKRRNEKKPKTKREISAK
jgi:hypothetical protein